MDVRGSAAGRYRAPRAVNRVPGPASVAPLDRGIRQDRS
jgi:hypothetical protein